MQCNPITYTIFFILLLFNNEIFAQSSKIKYEAELQTIGTTNNTVPFWMRSNQYGSIPLSGVSQSFIGRVEKEYENILNIENQNKEKKIIDWGFGIEGRANVGKGSNFVLIEAYGKIKYGIFQIKAGRSKDVMGLNGDTTLSSGNFAISGNALGIPKFELAIPEYYRIPLIKGILSVKGNFSHGWVGSTPTANLVGKNPLQDKTENFIRDISPNTFLHQKSLYFRLGKIDWKLNLYGGFNHQVYWGNEEASNAPDFPLSNLESFFYVITGKAYGNKNLPTSKIGNQLGSIDFGVDYTFNNFKVMIYRQSFYDVGALSKLANIKDGLNGVAFENTAFNGSSNSFQWKKIVAELFYSKDQAGYPWSKHTLSGDEDYYNNYFYRNGWSYKNMGVGNPLVTTKHDAKESQATIASDYFINNRVVAAHLGVEGRSKNYSILSKLTYSMNYGTFGTSIYGKTRGSVSYPADPSNVFIPVEQISVYLEGMKSFSNNLNVGIATSLDNGKLLNNSFGLILKLHKSF